MLICRLQTQCAHYLTWSVQKSFDPAFQPASVWRVDLTWPSIALPERRVQVLILSPTRELACQTEKVILAVGEYMNVQAHACIGGKSLGEWQESAHEPAQAVSTLLCMKVQTPSCLKICMAPHSTILWCACHLVTPPAACAVALRSL